MHAPSSQHGSEWTELRARCRERVTELVRVVGIPDPWDMNLFVDRLETWRGRQIDLCAVQWTHGASSGAWRAYPDHDVIAYSTNTSGLHQDAIILHEIAHLLAGHRGRCVLSAEQARLRAPDLAPAAFAHLLERVSLADEEREAETTATMIIALIAGRRPRGGALSGRIESTFG